MPVFTTALTLADYAMQSNDPAVQKITLSLLDSGSILTDLPLVTNEALKVDGRRITGADLPATGWGRINQTPSPIKTTTQSFEEQASLIREIIQIDRRLLGQKNWIDDPIETQITGAMAAHNYDMNDAFFNNDPANGGNPDAWVGLRARVRNPKLYGLALNADNATTHLDVDASGIDLRQSMIDADMANDWLEIVGQAFAYLGASDGRGCVAYTNWLVKERWNRCVRTLGAGGGFRIDRDAFDREVEMYRQCKVRDIGFKKDQSSLILSNTLDASGNETGSGGYTELFIVRYGPAHFKGWQTNVLKPEYLGRSTEYGTYENVLIDWGCGLYYPNNRSFVRIKNIRIA